MIEIKQFLDDIYVPFMSNNFRFPYRRYEDNALTTCKEIAMRFEVFTSAVIILLPKSKAPKREGTKILTNFKKLSEKCGIKISNEQIELANINGNWWLLIRGWWARSILRRELCRMIIKSGSCDDISLVPKGYYEPLFSDSLRSVFTNEDFKSWAESNKARINKTLAGGGIFTWIKRGIVEV